MAMKKTITLALLFVVATTALAAGVLADGDEQREFDFWTFSMFWAPAVCQRTTECCNTNACCRSTAPIKFTIEGLWPDYDDGTYPSFCNCTNKFNLREIAPLIPSLEENWPFLSCNYTKLCGNKTSRMDWATQWEKHGTCSGLDQYSYFLKALRLYNDYKMLDIFSNGGVSPSNSETYRFAKIVKEITNAVGAAPTIVCDGDYIRKVRLCFSKDFTQRRDCDHTGFVCPKYVKLPTYGPLSNGRTVEGKIAEVVGDFI